MSMKFRRRDSIAKIWRRMEEKKQAITH